MAHPISRVCWLSNDFHCCVSDASKASNANANANAGVLPHSTSLRVRMTTVSGFMRGANTPPFSTPPAKPAGAPVRDEIAKDGAPGVPAKQQPKTKADPYGMTNKKHVTTKAAAATVLSYFCFVCQRPRAAPVGSMMMLNQPMLGTSWVSFMIFAPRDVALALAALTSSTRT